MKAVSYKLNTVLAAVVGLACLVIVLMRAFAPYTVLPLVDIPNLAAISIAALVVECYLNGKARPVRCWTMTAVLALLTFWLLPWAAGLTNAAGALRVGVIGALLFTVLTFMFTGISDRLSSGKCGIVAPLFTGAVLYLACQGFMSILL